MPLFTKPQFNTVWASTGTKLAPDVAKINQGWVVEIPPHEFDNWMQNRQDALLAHLNQLGIPMWDQTVEYQAGKSYVQGPNTGTVFRALTTNTNINPELDIQNNWAVAFVAQADALLKAQNLADVPDKAAARANLGIATTEFYDNRYLIKSQNLADVPNKATARTNLDIYSKQEVLALLDTIYPAGEVTYFATDTAPEGYYIADGSLKNRTTDARLFARIGTRFGAGNGTTTFALPNLLGEFIRGWDGGRGIDPGRVFGSWQVDELRSHRHFTPTITRDVYDSTGGDGGYGQDTPTGSGPNVFTSTTGGTETRPRNVALLPCIRR